MNSMPSALRLFCNRSRNVIGLSQPSDAQRARAPGSLQRAGAELRDGPGRSGQPDPSDEATCCGAKRPQYQTL
jgi:hypothetical protein